MQKKFEMSIDSERSKPEKNQLSERLQKAAKGNANGWIYKVDSRYAKKMGGIPFEGIIGWWKVDVLGKIVGDFMPNPEYRPFNSEAEE